MANLTNNGSAWSEEVTQQSSSQTYLFKTGGKYVDKDISLIVNILQSGNSDDIEALLRYVNESTDINESDIGEAIRLLVEGYRNIGVETGTFTTDSSSSASITLQHEPIAFFMSDNVTITQNGYSYPAMGGVDLRENNHAHGGLGANEGRSFIQFLVDKNGTNLSITVAQVTSTTTSNKTYSYTAFYINNTVNSSGGGDSSVNLQDTKTVSITSNGTIDVYPDSGYEAVKKLSVTVNVPSNTFATQSKEVTLIQDGTTTYTPDSGKDGFSSFKVTVNTGINAVKSELTALIEDNASLLKYANGITGTKDTDLGEAVRRLGNGYGSSSGSTKNVQYYMGVGRVAATAYTSTGVSLTVATTGTYKVSWVGFRQSASGTNGSQLYIGNTAYGSANTTFTNTYSQAVILNNVSLTQGQTVEVRARSRSTSYGMFVGNLIIEQQ